MPAGRSTSSAERERQLTEAAVMAAMPVVEVTRRDRSSGQDIVESAHAVHLAVTGVDGQVLAGIGAPDQVVYVRSAAKPLQATVCLEVLDEHSVAVPEGAALAVGWASHRGEPRHLAAVTELLARAGRTPDDLTCPPGRSRAAPGAPASRLQHNCSGKHALFAVAGEVLGLTGAQVLDPALALQDRILGELERELGTVSAVAVDGCGAPAVAAPLSGLAGAFARLASEPRHGRVRAAGFAYPFHVGGHGRLESALLGAGVVAKVGAEGVFAAGWNAPDGTPRGLAVKAVDGATRAATAVTIAVLDGLGVVPKGTWAPAPPLGGGEPVGRLRSTPVVDTLVGQLRSVGQGA